MVTNIDVNEIIAQKVEKDEALKQAQEKKKQFTKVEFNVNNYLDTRLSKDENEKEITIRLLPFHLQNSVLSRKLRFIQLK